MRSATISKSQSFIVIMRWIVAVSVPILCWVSKLWLRSYDLLGIVVFISATSIITVCYFKRIYLNRYVWGAIHAVDLVSISLMIMGRNGIRSECFNVYYLVVLQAGLVFGVRQAIACLLFGSILYTGSVMMTGPDDADIRKLIVRIIYFWLVGATTSYLAYLEKKYRKQAFTDTVTSTYSRSFLEQSLRHEIKNAYYHKTQLSIVMIDIDNFKAINDRFGHKSGDMVLEQVADIIQSNIRDIDFVARYGGEEFIVALPQIGPDMALEIAERIRSAVENTEFWGVNRSYPISVTVSCGIAIYPMQGDNPEDLMLKADEYLYEAKRAGRNRVYYKTG